MRGPSQEGFRSGRWRLPPEAFGFAVGPDEPPRDIVGEEVWRSIVSFPDDVSLRSSDHQGQELETMHSLWSSWVQSYGEEQDPMWHFMLDSADEFQACIFNSLCGFYRVGGDCLRTSIELSTLGAYFQLLLDTREFQKWRMGKRDGIRFGMACDLLPRHSRVEALDEYLKSKLGFSMFGQKTEDHPGGWVRRLYHDLSEFTHSRPGRTSSAMWMGSNGPIYVETSFQKIFVLYLETVAVAFSILKLARPQFELPAAARLVFETPSVRTSKVAVYTFEFLFGR